MNRPFPLMIALFSISSYSLAAADIQPIDSLSGAAYAFVSSQLTGDAEYQISAAAIDPRLQLPLCKQPLQTYVQSGEVKAGRNTIGVRCSDPAWQIFNMVQVKAFKQVLILNTALRRNDVIRAEHMNIELRDIGLLPAGYITDASQIIDKQVTRNLAQGTALNRQHYTEPMLIKRGQQISIQSGIPGLLISAPGMAMSDGVTGQTISVKNLSSSRIIQAVVINGQQVMVNR